MSDKQAKYILVGFLAFVFAMTIVGAQQRYTDIQIELAKMECGIND